MKIMSGVDGDRVFDFFEQVFVIDDVAEVFVLTVEAEDGLQGAPFFP